MKRLHLFLLATAIVASLTGALLAPLSSFALPANMTIQSGAEAAHGNGQPSDIFGSTGVFTTLSNVLLFVIGALSVIMLIIGGLRYVLSGGNGAAVTAAKNTILYAIIGIIVAMLAYAIVHFVINSFATGGTSGTNV